MWRLGWVPALPRAVECPVHFDPCREAWQRQLALCPSWERAPQHPSLHSQWDRGEGACVSG